MVNGRLRRESCGGAVSLNHLLTALLAAVIPGVKSFSSGASAPIQLLAASVKPVLPPTTWFLVCSCTRQPKAGFAVQELSWLHGSPRRAAAP